MNVCRLFSAALLLASGCATYTLPTESFKAEAYAAAAADQQDTAPAPTAEPAQVAPATPTTVAPATPVEKKFHPDDLVCRTYEVTGSRVQQQRICKTRQQWIDDAREAREQFKKVQDANAHGQPLEPRAPGN